MSNQPGRDKWATRLGIVLAMSANAVGLGNFLRFPVQCVNNGGGAFMIPYFVALFLLGIPLMWIEWSIGRFGGQHGHGTTPGMFHHLWKHPVSKYLGAIGIIIPFGLVVYYTYIESWTLAYSFFSLTGKYFNLDQHGVADFLLAYQGRVHNEHFQGIGTAYVFALITMALNVWILFKGISGGIEKLAKIAMPLIIILGIGLVIRVFTIGTPDPAYPDRNVWNGLGFVWNPNFSALLDSRIWLAAAGQIFFTLSVGFGAIQNYASFLSKKDDIAASGLATSATNEFVEVILGGSIAIPITFAFFGLQQTQEFAAGGSFNLGFFAMPLIFQRLPLGELFGTAWFLLLFLAGVTSSVAMAQPLISFLEEELHIARKRAVAIVSISAFVLMQPVIFFLKFGFLDEMDFWIGTFGLVVFAFLEVVLLMWIYDSKKAWDEMNEGGLIRIPRFFFYIMKYITPVYLLVLITVWFFKDGIAVLTMRGVPAENHLYIWMARALLAGMAVAAVLLVRAGWKKRYPDLTGTGRNA